MNTASSDWEKHLRIPGRVTFAKGAGDLPMLKLRSEVSDAKIYLHGAHVAHFQKRNEPPLLFLSSKSQFVENQPIRGGVPVIFPWFGPKDGAPMHGFARLKTWSVEETKLRADGSVGVKLRLPDCPEALPWPAFGLELEVIVGKALEMRLTAVNKSADQNLLFENCLHTYFSVAQIGGLSVSGLKGRTFVDKVDNFLRKEEAEEAIRIAGEVNRVYEDTTGPVEIHDAKLGRTIRIETQGANSAVVWNPGIARAKEMADFGDREYLKMVCVESGNVAKNNLTLAPGQSSTLAVKISSNMVAPTATSAM